ncbi:MAG: alpha/beta hydrolase [Alphaproteobacteria bacterium]
MANIFILSGTYGSPFDNWQPWLYQQLTAQGHTVFVPHFPSPAGQNLETWSAILQAYEPFWNENTVVVAHSIGCAFAVDYILAAQQMIKGAVLVSPFYSAIGIESFDTLNATFLTRPVVELKMLGQLCRTIKAFHGEDDPYVPLPLAQEFCKTIGTAPAIIGAGGHLNSKAGFQEFPRVLEAVIEISNGARLD